MSAGQWNEIKKYVEEDWDSTIVPALEEYIKVPNQSPNYDPEWATNGLMMKAFNILVEWVKKQSVKGFKYEMHEEPGRTPFMIMEIQATAADNSGKTCLMYGHMDKQPPLPPGSWSEGLDPYVPVYRDGKLYGRGGADDGYAIFSSLSPIIALQKQGIDHGRIVIVIEACEESGSFDLPFYMDKCKAMIGDVDLIVCLDSGAANYDQMWITNSLRGCVVATLTVETLAASVHSGTGGGVCPDGFNIIRELLDRIHDPKTGDVLLKELHCEIPASVKKGLECLRDVSTFQDTFPNLKGVNFEGKTLPADNAELAIRNFWMPSVTVIGTDLPDLATAGNVIRSGAAVKISCRIPPKTQPAAALAALKKELERDPPYNAKVSVSGGLSAGGWAPPELAPWLEKSMTEGSSEYFGKPLGFCGMGGSIPLMGTLSDMFPAAQFAVIGVLGPASNAHGPDEFLHVPFAKGVTYTVARILAGHYASHQ